MIDERLREFYPHINGDCTFHISLGVTGVITHASGDYNYVGTRAFCEDTGMSDEETVIWLLKFGNYLPYSFDNGELKYRNYILYGV